jgi:hypothetical protein
MHNTRTKQCGNLRVLEKVLIVTENQCWIILKTFMMSEYFPDFYLFSSGLSYVTHAAQIEPQDSSSLELCCGCRFSLSQPSSIPGLTRLAIPRRVGLDQFESSHFGHFILHPPL